MENLRVRLDQRSRTELGMAAFFVVRHANWRRQRQADEEQTLSSSGCLNEAQLKDSILVPQLTGAWDDRQHKAQYSGYRTRISLPTTRNAASPSSPIPQHKSDSTKTCKWLFQVTQGLPGLALENNRLYLLWGSCCSGHAGDLGSRRQHCTDESTNILHLKWLRFKVSGKVSFLLCLWSDVETPIGPEEAFPKEILLYPE